MSSNLPFARSYNARPSARPSNQQNFETRNIAPRQNFSPFQQRQNPRFPPENVAVRPRSFHPRPFSSSAMSTTANPRDDGEMMNYNRQLSKFDWQRYFGKVPSFDQYREFMAETRRVDWSRFCAREPEFQHFVAFKKELDSKNWLSLCNFEPTFLNFMEFLDRIDKLSDAERSEVNPTFRDFVDYYLIGKGGQVWAGICDVENTFKTFLSFADVRDETNWREVSPQLGAPTFKHFLRYRACLLNMDFMAVFERIPKFSEFVEFLEVIGKPQFDDRLQEATFKRFLEFGLHAKSRDWVDFCDRQPRFLDYINYLSHENGENWQKLKANFNDKPYFTDYMKFLQICDAKQWRNGADIDPSFNEFIEYLVYRASRDWKALVGRIPTFVDFVEYIQATMSREWRAMGGDRPTFQEFMLRRVTNQGPPDRCLKIFLTGKVGFYFLCMYCRMRFRSPSPKRRPLLGELGSISRSYARSRSRSPPERFRRSRRTRSHSRERFRRYSPAPQRAYRSRSRSLERRRSSRDR